MVRQGVPVAVCEDRSCGFDRFEPESVDRLRRFENIQREMDRGSAGYDLILSIRRNEMVFHRAVGAGLCDSGLAREAVRAGVLDQESKNKKKHDGP